MSTGKMIANGSFPGIEGTLINDGPVHIGAAGTFGGGSIAIEQRINGTWTPVLNEQVAVALTADDDAAYMFGNGDQIRLTLTGATTPAINYRIGTKS